MMPECCHSNSEEWDGHSCSEVEEPSPHRGQSCSFSPPPRAAASDQSRQSTPCLGAAWEGACDPLLTISLMGSIPGGDSRECFQTPKKIPKNRLRPSPLSDIFFFTSRTAWNCGQPTCYQEESCPQDKTDAPKITE